MIRDSSTTTTTKLITSIKAKALGLGFQAVGFTSADSLSEGKSLRKWLESGFEAGMAWMQDPETREDPKTLLPEAKSVIIVSLNYFNAQELPQDPAVGRIARYALGDDYHDVMKERLQQLAQFIRENFQAAARTFTDTSHVMEKALAQRAGIGWIGKNGMVIRKDSGSWFFLGGILTDLVLEYDQPAASHCGTCTRCLEACPTQAIVSPGVIDSNKCIAYLTIEHKGEIPQEFHQAMGNRIFGCDDCQEVCPWNSFAEPTQEPAFAPRHGLLSTTLTDYAQMTDEQFRHRFQTSPVKRAKYNGFLRNVEIALGNAVKEVNHSGF